MRVIDQLREYIAPLLQISEIRSVAADDLWMSPCYKQACICIHLTWRKDWEGVRNILLIIEEAFEGDPSHSLIANLHDVQEEDWTATPLGSHRSITDILEHVGWSKWMYEDYAFGSATMRGD